jgi:hypothetical protein
MEALAGDVENTSDAYQYERAAARLGVSQRAIGDALTRLNVSYKKHCRIRKRTKTHGAFFKVR